jgi:hypothetical protein
MWQLLIALFYTIYKVYALVDCLKSCFSLCFDSLKDMTLFEEKKEMNRYFECYFAEKWAVAYARQMVFMMVCCIFMTYPWGYHPFCWARYLVDCDKFWGCKHISAGYTEMMKKWISN